MGIKFGTLKHIGIFTANEKSGGGHASKRDKRIDPGKSKASFESLRARNRRK